MKNYKQLNQNERDRIEALLTSGHKLKEIAGVLERNKGTISREIKRGSREDRRYKANYAHHRAYVRRKYSKYQGMKINENKELKKYIVQGLRRCWNPDEISGRMEKEKQPFYASKTAIYEWLYSVWGQRYCFLLPRRQYKKKHRGKKKTKREMIPNRKGREYLPLDFGLNFGDFEADTMISGKKTGSKTALSVLYGIRSGWVRISLIPNLKPAENERVIQKMIGLFPFARVILRDNGLENREHERTIVPSCFCDPFSAWQKPHVENANKLLRRFFPKGCDFNQYSQEYISWVEWILNNKPRKSLSYKKPIEILFKNGLFSNPPKVNQYPINFNRSLVALRG